MGMAPPSYRERLRLEGSVLALCGALASLVLMVAVEEATDMLANTFGQLALVALLLGAIGPRYVRGWLDGARPLTGPGEAGSGEPTPLWHLPLVMLALLAPVGLGAGWDAGLRITAGCMLVGLAQACVFAPLVARHEAARGVVFFRLPGSRILRGTRLGALTASS